VNTRRVVYVLLSSAGCLACSMQASAADLRNWSGIGMSFAQATKLNVKDMIYANKVATSQHAICVRGVAGAP
jgi:hypothetical protein